MKRMALATMAVLAMAGCGGSTDQKATTTSSNSTPAPGSPAAQTGQTTAQSAQQMAQGLQQMLQGVQQTGADGKPVQVVDFEKLTPLLPDVDGWDKGKVDGSTTTVGLTVSQASAPYTRGDFRVKVTITDAALSQAIMAPAMFGMAMANTRSTSGYERPATFAGQPGHEKWNSDDKHAETTIIVNKRFIVSIEGSGIDSPDPVKDFANKIDVAKIAALK